VVNIHQQNLMGLLGFVTTEGVSPSDLEALLDMS
jgi:hypothetical protein